MQVVEGKKIVEASQITGNDLNTLTVLTGWKAKWKQQPRGKIWDEILTKILVQNYYTFYAPLFSKVKL